MRATFTGFDSAWGARNTGALCELVLRDDGSLVVRGGEPSSATWHDAVGRAGRGADGTLNVWAVDQPLCVANESGCRPAEADLARALMADFACGAHSSNLSNPCWAAGARIWDLLRALEANGYRHHPMAIPGAAEGRFYFECYPHPALLGLFDLDRILTYKVRHRDEAAWLELVRLLRGLETADLPVTNIGEVLTPGLTRSQDNENKLDALIAAYVAAYWWKYGTDRSSMVGDTSTGYIVTPHSERTRLALAEVFRGRWNMPGVACAAPPDGAPHLPVAAPATDIAQTARGAVEARLPAEPSDGWAGPITLRATDTTNLWRKSRGSVINSWMDASRVVGWRLWVRFCEQDGEPAVLFVPFENQGSEQRGMRSATQQMNRALWHLLVANATRVTPVDFAVLYRYEPV